MADILGFARERPVRVAFLVPDDEYAHIRLDAVFANCHSRWGGRYSLVVPCHDGKARAVYLTWLESFDPDIVYSYIDMDDAEVARFHERFGPSYLIHHEPYDRGERDRRYFRPELPFPCLTSLAVAPQYGKAHPPSAPHPMLIVDRLISEPSNRFVDDNFGSIVTALNYWPLPEHLSDVVRPLYLASNETRAKWQMGRMPSGEFVEDVSALLTKLAQQRNSYGLAQLAADSAPRFEMRDLTDASFRIVVGDSFADRVVFWNDRSRFPAYIGREFVNLIVSADLLQDNSFFAALVDFLNARIRQRNGHSWVELASTSVPHENLEMYAKRFREAATYIGYQVAPTVSLDDVPDAQSLEYASYGLVTGHSFGARPAWREFPVGSRTATPPVLIPSILEGISPSRATEGAWAIDVELQRQKNLSRYSNIKHKWYLPRRLRIHGAFLAPYRTSSVSPLLFPRATAVGALAYYAQLNEPPPTITIPDDWSAIGFSILQGRDWPPFSKRSDGSRDGAYKYIRPSDKGRYLLGTFGLFGGVQPTGCVLLHQFWKSVFDALGAAVGSDRKQDILNALRKRLKSHKLETEDEWERLASLVAAEAQRVRIPLRTIGFRKLRSLFDPFLERERRALAESAVEDPEEWLVRATSSLAASTRWLCSSGVLYQGYEWRCHECFHTNWSGVQSLQPKLTCEVCQTESVLPVDKAWDFRLNDFLRDALKEHGVLAIVWCILRLENRSRDSFFFLEPTELFSSYPQDERTPPTNEADLICIVDGKTYLCEVKSSARGVDINSLIRVTKILRPDVALLAVMEKAPQALLGKFELLKRELAEVGIAAELLEFSEPDLKDDVWLPG